MHSVENTEVSIRPMYKGDIGNCVLLSGAEGWNQTERDWERLLEGSGNICRVAEHAGKIIGTATACNYNNDIAWIGMVLVDKAFRGRGISKMLLTEVLAQLSLCKSVKLDATPAGHPVYEKLDFKDEFVIFRMTGIVQDGFQPDYSGHKPEPVQLQHIQDIIALDTSIFGAERSDLIISLLKEDPDKAWVIRKEGKITGFTLGRQGRKYIQIGPVSASDITGAIALISHVLAGHTGKPVVADVPGDKPELIKWLNSTGFMNQRHFVRMYQYSNPIPGTTENQFLICGPEFG